MVELIISELKRNKGVFSAFLKETSEQQYLWKPEPSKWCLLEVACHLYDEEREDFRARLKHVLENPELPLPPIDPLAWVSDRSYLQQDYNKVVSNFLKEREKSVEWLKSLESPKWENTYAHPKPGKLSASIFLANWVAHDDLHFRQITRLKYGWLREMAGEDLSYAGEW